MWKLKLLFFPKLSASREKVVSRKKLATTLVSEPEIFSYLIRSLKYVFITYYKYFSYNIYLYATVFKIILFFFVNCFTVMFMNRFHFLKT